MSNLRWKLVTIVGVFIVFFAVGVYPIVAARYGIHSPAFLLDKLIKLGWTSRAASTSSSAFRPTMRCGCKPRPRRSGCARS